jgi:hypothetical protein
MPVQLIKAQGKREKRRIFREITELGLVDWDSQETEIESFSFMFAEQPEGLPGL